MNRNDQEFMVQKIRTQYMEKENTKLNVLKALDKKVKRPATAFGYVFGSLGAIIMGSGMSLVMTDVGQSIGITDGMTVGIVIGIIGMLMVIVNYPIYKKILCSRREKYASEIIALSDELISNQ